MNQLLKFQSRLLSGYFCLFKRSFHSFCSSLLAIVFYLIWPFYSSVFLSPSLSFTHFFIHHFILLFNLPTLLPPFISIQRPQNILVFFSHLLLSIFIPIVLHYLILVFVTCVIVQEAELNAKLGYFKSNANENVPKLLLLIFNRDAIQCKWISEAELIEFRLSTLSFAFFSILVIFEILIYFHSFSMPIFRLLCFFFLTATKVIIKYSFVYCTVTGHSMHCTTLHTISWISAIIMITSAFSASHLFIFFWHCHVLCPILM